MRERKVFQDKCLTVDTTPDVDRHNERMKDFDRYRAKWNLRAKLLEALINRIKK